MFKAIIIFEGQTILKSLGARKPKELRDRPFILKVGGGGGGGYGFLFRSEFFFRTTQELEYLFLLSPKARILFPEFNIRIYYKNSNQIFFFLYQNQNLFFSNIGNQNIFLEKNNNPPPPPPPPLQVKWSFPKQNSQNRLWSPISF